MFLCVLWALCGLFVKEDLISSLTGELKVKIDKDENILWSNL